MRAWSGGVRLQNLSGLDPKSRKAACFKRSRFTAKIG